MNRPGKASDAERKALSWKSPPYGVLRVHYPIDNLIHRTDSVAVSITFLEIYPNGFTINLKMIFPIRSDFGLQFVERRRKEIGDLAVDVQFGDESSVSTSAPESRDTRGRTTPFVALLGEGGGSHEWDSSVWVSPLPPDGTLTITVNRPSVGLSDGKCVLNGSSVRKAAENALVLWE
jgi:hypothetical protein